MEKDFLGSIFDGIIKYWLQILVIIIIVLAWHYGTFKDLLGFVGTCVLGYLAFKLWVHYIQQDFISGIEFTVLEVIPPRDVLRSPKAMELFITNAFYHWSQKGGKEEFWQGAVWFWFSLEIASIDGQVHFYIRTPSRIRGLIETQMYAQYPQAQVREVEDYTLAVDEITPKSSWNAWGCEFKLNRPEAFPIKTYVDFGLDKDPKEEFKVDPISPLIEFFGSLGKGEQAWIQFVIKPAKIEYHTSGTWFGKHDWIAEALVEQGRLLKDFTSVKGKGETLGVDSRIEIRVPEYLTEVVKGMNNKRTKLGFETGVRMVYIAKKEIFPVGQRNNNSRNIRLVLRQYANPSSNEFSRFNGTQGDAFGSSIMPLSPREVMSLSNRMLREYQERAFYHLPLRHHLFSEHSLDSLVPIPILNTVVMYIVQKFFLPYFHHQTFILNTEELATIWHFPGQILKVPTLERIESKEAAPPTNLPI